MAIHRCTERGLAESLNDLGRPVLFDTPEIAGEKLAQWVGKKPSSGFWTKSLVARCASARATSPSRPGKPSPACASASTATAAKSSPTRAHSTAHPAHQNPPQPQISATRFPRDGRFSIHPGSKTANFRVSTIPSAEGEKTLIRILAMTRKKTIRTMEKMIISQTILQPLKRLIQNPNGIIFVTGPTGSGKTTTLYAAMHEITRAASLFAPSRIRSKSSSPA